MGERGTRPRPLLDVDVDTERDFDEYAEDAWRSSVFVIEERCLLWSLNGRQALTLTALL